MNGKSNFTTIIFYYTLLRGRCVLQWDFYLFIFFITVYVLLLLFNFSYFFFHLTTAYAYHYYYYCYCLIFIFNFFTTELVRKARAVALHRIFDLRVSNSRCRCITILYTYKPTSLLVFLAHRKDKTIIIIFFVRIGDAENM
jgi:hypothetical protein